MIPPRVLPLARYQLALLLRSQCWVAPVVLYAALVVGGAAGGQELGDSLAWAGAALIPVTAWVSRLVVTAESTAERAVVAAVVGPRRVQATALAVALLFAAVLGAAGVVFEYFASVKPPPGAPRSAGSVLLQGVIVVVICLLAGSAAGAVSAPPLVHGRGPGLAALAAVVLAWLVMPLSPANAAIRSQYTAAPDPTFALLAPVIGVLVLTVLAWTTSLVCVGRGRA
ncbi:hypothetical protein [Yinghuangia soli]|uniref:Uncharacterized protein n=1 Tax=Yinghuangia soli TaxID=2908204 RepID=A0AA41PZ14_9ACTN|nr:hypothetical protein [Yinghuangia soli]MCF2527082.1 hypothetical protein [Yinghuangia soli]